MKVDKCTIYTLAMLSTENKVPSDVQKHSQKYANFSCSILVSFNMLFLQQASKTHTES